MLEEIFLCHASEDTPEIRLLAEALRLRGVVPWVDKEGGFKIGDENVGEAERVIGEDCFGLLLYATPEVFESDFIRQVEIRKAIQRKEDDPAFILFAVPRRIGFKELSRLSVQTFGTDLAAYSSRAIEAHGEDARELREQVGLVADEVLDRVLSRVRDMGITETLQMQLSTRERLADEPEDNLSVDATRIMERSKDSPGEAWKEIRQGLFSIRRSVSRHLGRPRLRVHGSKHLTAAFLLGHAFPSTVCELEVRTKRGYWSTDCNNTDKDLMQRNVSSGTMGMKTLYVEISTGEKTVREGVRRHVSRTGSSPFKYLRFTPGPELKSTSNITNMDARAIAKQIRREISYAVSEYGISEIHLFAAVPQALAVLLGHNFNAMPPIQLYEYDGNEYHSSITLA